MSMHKGHFLSHTQSLDDFQSDVVFLLSRHTQCDANKNEFFNNLHDFGENMMDNRQSVHIPLVCTALTIRALPTKFSLSVLCFVSHSPPNDANDRHAVKSTSRRVLSSGLVTDKQINS